MAHSSTVQLNTSLNQLVDTHHQNNHHHHHNNNNNNNHNHHNQVNTNANVASGSSSGLISNRTLQTFLAENNINIILGNEFGNVVGDDQDEDEEDDDEEEDEEDVQNQATSLGANPVTYINLDNNAVNQSLTNVLGKILNSKKNSFRNSLNLDKKKLSNHMLPLLILN